MIKPYPTLLGSFTPEEEFVSSLVTHPSFLPVWQLADKCKGLC